jgi:hypothetical protein
MRSLFKKTMLLTASLIVTSAVWATIAGGASTSNTVVNAAGCGEGSLRIYKCVSDNPLDAGCGNGNLEGCAVAQDCSNISNGQQY